MSPSSRVFKQTKFGHYFTPHVPVHAEELKINGMIMSSKSLLANMQPCFAETTPADVESLEIDIIGVYNDTLLARTSKDKINFRAGDEGPIAPILYQLSVRSPCAFSEDLRRLPRPLEALCHNCAWGNQDRIYKQTGFKKD